jgi:hypothetical protein
VAVNVGVAVGTGVCEGVAVGVGLALGEAVGISVGAAVDVAVGAALAVAAGVGVGLTALVGVALAVTHGSSRSQSGSSFPPLQAEHKAANASAKATPRNPGMVLVMAKTASCSECPRVKRGRIRASG